MLRIIIVPLFAFLFSCVPRLARVHSIAGEEKKSKPVVSLITDQYRLSVGKTLVFQGRGGG